MAGTHFSRVLRAKIEEARKKYIESNGRGSASTYDEYKWAAGHIAGLEHAMRLLEEVEGEQDK